MKLRIIFAFWFFLMAMLLAAHFASAQIKTIGVHTLTQHDPGRGANDMNFGVFAVTEQGFVIGGYYNSHYRMAYYGGWSTPEWYRMKLSFIGVTGYTAGILPIVIPSVKLYQFDGPSLWLSGSPVKMGENGQSILHLTLAWDL